MNKSHQSLLFPACPERGEGAVSGGYIARSLFNSRDEFDGPWTTELFLSCYLDRIFKMIYGYKGKITVNGKFPSFGIHLFNVDFNIYL